LEGEQIVGSPGDGPSGARARRAVTVSEPGVVAPQPMAETPAVLDVANVSYRYSPDAAWAVRQVALQVAPGESVALMGPSGCGKSTLLLLCAGVLGLTDGSITVCGQQLAGMSANQRADLRRSGVGLVFQFGELIAELSLLDNVALVAELSGASRAQALEMASAILKRVGLTDVAHAKPGAVSGGQAQRCAVARAVVHQPRLVLADEPTGALDRRNAQNVLELLGALCRERNAALLVATHDPATAETCTRRLAMLDGRV